MRAGRNCLHGLALAGLAAAFPAAAADELLYRVEPGDTVIGISQRKLVDPSLWRKLARLNQLRNPDLIFPGRQLRIPLDWVKRVATSAEVVEAGGGATVSAKRAATPLRAGIRVEPGAEITTAGDGFVTLRLADGSSVRIKSGTQMRVDALTRIPDTEQHQSLLRLIFGRLEVVAARLRGPATRFRIETPVGAATVRGTDFRVTGENGKPLQRTEVLDGRVAVAGRGSAAETAVEAGFGAMVDAAGSVSQPVALLAAPDLSKLPGLQERTLVRFRLDSLEGAAAWRGQIGSAPGFSLPIAEVVSASPELRFQDLPDGDYVLRARAVDVRGLEGRDAEHAFRLKARPEPPIPSTPPSNTKLRGVSVEFSWSENRQADHYRFQLAQDPGFAAIMSDIPAVRAVTHREAGPLAPGTYYWRVGSIPPHGERGPFGDPQMFTLLPPPAQPEPPRIGDNDVTFSWSGEPGQRFQFELARDDRFTVELTRHELTEPRVVLPRPAPDVWYIRYRAIDSDGYVGPYTSPQRFTVAPCIIDTGGRCVGVGSGGVLAPGYPR